MKCLHLVTLQHQEQDPTKTDSNHLEKRLLRSFLRYELNYMEQMEHGGDAVSSNIDIYHPQKAERPGPVRPKRQRPRPSQNKQPVANFQEDAFNDIPEDDLGFFSDVNFPDISTFGVFLFN